ncbi:MAG: Glu/Leu/Phe/Val dehydrogenase dimerization domain-containing protein [bacterium]|nr:Glu/Leu/Phe/Val dehydrogenase dimerization domain-containing protein [bacterium]
MQRLTDDTVRNHPDFDNHMMVIHITRERFGLEGIIAIHDTTFGDATGGTRFWPYTSVYAALNDVLPLSRDMTYKSVTANVPWGGAKSVLIGDAEKDKTEDMVRAYAYCIEKLRGLFNTGEDMGFHVPDVDIMAEITKHVFGRSVKEYKDGIVGGGDPSLSTKHGVLCGIQVVLEFLYGDKSFRGKSFCVQGVGATGLPIAKALSEGGGTVFISDMSQRAIDNAVKNINAPIIVVPPGIAHKVSCDVFVPCAGGRVINEKTVDEFDCRAIAGSANCIFTKSTAPSADYLHAIRNILVAPAYVINGGGLIHIYHEKIGFNAAAVRRDVEKIRDRLIHIFKESALLGKPPYKISDEIVERKLHEEESRHMKL